MTATSDFQYDLPDGAIAQVPTEPRHNARLLDTKTMSDRQFWELPQMLRPGDVVVVNRTRVRRARLVGRKPTGGAVELLLLRKRSSGEWEALARPSRRLRAGLQLDLGGLHAEVTTDPIDGMVTVAADGDLESAAEAIGEVPLPPYFSGVLKDPERYQTMFADSLGSAAAPTAGLHFTPQVVAGLGTRGVSIERIDLEVGLDTFRPVATATIEDHSMHAEQFAIDAATADRILTARLAGGRVIAVGTTVVRALESAAVDGVLRATEGNTRLFIRPGHEFQVVDLVVTNFHVPGSTLVVMLAAILGDRWRQVYTEALDRGYRFLSFGDAMLAEVTR